MSIFDIVCTLLAVVLMFLTVSRSRERFATQIIALEFVVTAGVTALLINHELHKVVGGHWLFALRALALFAAIKLLSLHKCPTRHVINWAMGLGVIVNFGAYVEYATRSYGVFDYSYTYIASAVVVTQLIYGARCGIAGTWVRKGYCAYARKRRDLNLRRVWSLANMGSKA